MDLEQGYLQGMRHEQSLSPAQMENLQILAMNRQELTDFLLNEQMENPMLELDDTSGFQWDGIILGEWVNYRDSLEKDDRAVRNEDGCFREIPDRQEQTLHDYLCQQIPAEADKRQQVLTEKLTGLLDESTGYFQVEKEEILRAAGKEAESAIRLIREMDPPGVGAFGLKDCLKMQLDRKGVRDRILYQIIDDYLEEVAENRFSTISRALKISTEKTRHYVRMIKELNPRPAKCFGGGQPVYVVPDIRAFKEEKWEIALCGRGSRELHLNETYMQMASRASDEQLIQYFERKIKRARQVIRAVEQREETLVRLMSFILEYQGDFALGKGGRVPLLMKDAAEVLGIHPSTVSRAVKDKYVELPCGVVPLKDLFPGNGSIKDEKEAKKNAGETLADEIRNIIKKEDPESPFSDQQISEHLKARGIKAARRTVAKYREMEGIPGAAGRKKK